MKIVTIAVVARRSVLARFYMPEVAVLDVAAGRLLAHIGMYARAA